MKGHQQMYTIIHETSNTISVSPSVLFYVAYSIHGTNTFYVATRTILGDKKYGLALLGPNFTEVPSRRPDYDVNKDGIKLHWARLRTIRSNKPLISPYVVEKRFRILEKMGWTIEKTFDIEKVKRIQKEGRAHSRIRDSLKEIMEKHEA